jgi:hypothetical protein
MTINIYNNIANLNIKNKSITNTNNIKLTTKNQTDGTVECGGIFVVLCNSMQIT